MVYKKYVWKNGRKFGPYYYESYRDGNKIKKRYIGTENKNPLKPYLLLSIIFIAAVLLSSFFIWKSAFTGKVVHEFDDDFNEYNYSYGEDLRGNFQLVLREGELIPKDSKIIISVGNISKEGYFWELSPAQLVSGNYYLSGFNLSGNGEGFGIAGTKTVYPSVDFQLEIYKDNKGSEDKDENEEYSENEENESESQEENETVVGFNITAENNTLEDDFNLTEENESEQQAENESIENSEPSSENNQSEQDNVDEQQEEESDSDEEQEDENEAESEDNEDGSNKEGKVSESLITGAAIFDDGEDDNKKDEIINGTASKEKDYLYNLPKKRTAEIVPGSVLFNNQAIGDDKISLEINESLAKVSTNYSVIYSGFGADYSGENFTLQVNLSRLSLPVIDEIVRIRIEYNNTSLLDFERRVSLNLNITNITLPQNITNQTLINETNITIINITNATILNFTSNITQKFSMVKDIIFLKIIGNESLKLNLSNYFIGAEDYSFSSPNIEWSISEETLNLKAKDDFRGYTNARITAYKDNINLSSREFIILVSSGDLKIQTIREKIILDEPVKWTKNITMGIIENITVELPSDAWNITVKKVEGESITQASASLIGLTGSVIEGSNEGSLFNTIGNFFNKLFGIGITGKVIALDSSLNLSNSTSSGNLQVKLSDNANAYLIEYYTQPPVSVENPTTDGKHVVVSAPDTSNYSNTIATTSIDNTYQIKSLSLIKVYWYNTDFDKPGGLNQTLAVEDVSDISKTEDTSDFLAAQEDTDVSTTLEGTIVATTINVTINLTANSNLTTASQDIDLDANLTDENLVLLANTTLNLGEGENYILQEIPFKAEDYDQDGNIDHVSWVVPHFSNQSYQIVFSQSQAYFYNVDFDGDYAHLNIADTSPYKNSGYVAYPGQGLVGYWSFDADNSSTAFDYSRNNLNGKYDGAALSNESGCIYGGCLKVNGISPSHINISDTSLFDIGTEGFTYTAWIKPASFANTYNMIMGHYLPYFNVRSSRILHMSMVAAGSQRHVYGTTLLNANQWYFVSTTYNSSGYMNVYLNGVLENSTGPYLTATNYNYDQFIGTWYSGLTYMFNGSIDEVMIFNYSLEDSQIASIYTNQSARFLSPGLTDGKQIQVDSGTGKTTVFNANGYKRKVGSNISARLGYWDVSKGYKSWDLGEHYVKLDGDGDYVTVPDSSSLDLTDTVSISLWLNIDSFGTYYASHLINKWTGTSDANYVLYFFGNYTGNNNQGLARVYANRSGIWDTVSPSYTFTNVKKWYHFVWVYNSTSGGLLYIDGQAQGSLTGSGPLTTNNAAFKIDSGYFNGSVDDVIVFNRTLNSSDITKLYEAGRDSGSFTDQGLVSWWDFNKGNANDLQGRNNGTLVGSAFVQEENHGLLAYWPFDNNYNDISGNGNHGSVESPHLNNSGVYNHSATIDGGGNYIITTPTLPAINKTSPYTFSAWLKLNTVASTQSIWQHGNSASDRNGIIMSTSVLRAGIYNGSDYIGAPQSASLSVGQWYYITYVYGGNQDPLLYLNGVLQSGTATVSSLDASSKVLGYTSNGGYYLNGSLDDVMIFNRSLTSAEVAELYAKGRARWEYTLSQSLKAIDSNDNRSSNVFSISSGTTNILPSYLLTADNRSFYTPLINTVMNSTLNAISNNVTSCSASSGCVFVRNKTGTNVAIFDKLGNLDIKGSLSIGGAGTPDGSDFIIKNSAGTVVAWIDGNTGNMNLAGSVIGDTGTYCTAASNSFIVKDNSGNCVSYIDSSGNVWLKGLFNQNSLI